jgi:hypothetical protein
MDFAMLGLFGGRWKWKVSGGAVGDECVVDNVALRLDSIDCCCPLR